MIKSKCAESDVLIGSSLLCVERMPRRVTVWIQLNFVYMFPANPRYKFTCLSLCIANNEKCFGCFPSFLVPYFLPFLPVLILYDIKGAEGVVKRLTER